MSHLQAEKLRNDPRVKKAKALLKEALEAHSAQINGLKKSDTRLADDYQQLMDDCAQARGGNLYYPYIGSGIGNGALVELADGSVKYDFITGIGPHFWGHSNVAMLESSIDAALADTVMQGNLQQNADSVELMENIITLANQSGANLEHCFLSTSGATANENALKLMFQKHHPAHRILCFEHCFAGRTLALSQMTDKAAYRNGLPTTIQVDYLPFFNPNAPIRSTQKCIQILDTLLARHAGQYAGMCIELVQGEAGYYPGSHDFFMAIIRKLKEHDIAVWADEVQTFGRTENPFAFQMYQLDEYIDIVTIGKLSQVCATLFKNTYKPKPGLISQTFTASTSAIHAGNTIMKSLQKDPFFGADGKNAQVHSTFRKYFERIAIQHPAVFRGPYGIGGMVAFTAFDGDMQKSQQFAHRLFEAGVMCFIAGNSPTRIRMLPPAACITHDDIRSVCSIIEDTLIELDEEFEEARKEKINQLNFTKMIPHRKSKARKKKKHASASTR